MTNAQQQDLTRRLLAAVAALGLALLPLAATARGRPPQAALELRDSAPSALVARALGDLGRGNFTPFREAWCADAVSAWLAAIGKPPLANHMAAAALAYGPSTDAPRPGDLVVIRTRRGAAGHVGVLVADFGASVMIVSGNWSRRVAEARVSRRSVTAFVRV